MPPNEAATVPIEDAALCRLQHHRPGRLRRCLAQFYGNLRFRGNVHRNRDVNRQGGVPHRLCATASPIEVVLTRPTKCACNGATATGTARSQRRARRSTQAHHVCFPSWHLTMRLSDAGLRQRQTKALYLNHRLPPWLTEDAPRDRSNRLLDGSADSDRCANLKRSRF